MLLVAQNQSGEIEKRSREFKSSFLELLRTSHGTKLVDANRIYNEYIADRDHSHMNATKWNSLTQFVQYLGREGICRVEIPDDYDGTASGIKIAWIDNSPEALRRERALQKKERQDKGDEEREQRGIQEQVERSRAERAPEIEIDPAAMELHKAEGETLRLDFGSKLVRSKASSVSKGADSNPPKEPSEGILAGATQTATPPENGLETAQDSTQGKLKLGMASSKPKNVFSAKNNPLGGKKANIKDQPKKMSEV